MPHCSVSGEFTANGVKASRKNNLLIKMEELGADNVDSSLSIKKERSEYEQQVQKTSAYMAALKVQVEKSFLDRKHEALERWMRKSQRDSHRTIKRVCNKAESVIHGMVEAKKKAMQDMVRKMEKDLQEELKELKEETRRQTLREFIQNNGRYLDKEKLTRIANLKAASANIKNSQSIVNDALISIKEETSQVNTPTIRGLQLSGLPPRGETSIAARYPEEMSSSTTTKMDELGEKEPICHTEMCLFTSLNQPQETHDEKCDQKLQEPPKEVCVTIRDPNRGTLVTCQFDSRMLTPKSDDEEGSESNMTDDESPWFTCTSCSRTSCEMLMCSRCRDSYYCNEDCQRNDWMAHQHTCTEYTEL